MKHARMIQWVLSLLAVLVGLGSCASSKGLSHDTLQDVIQQEESRFIYNTAATGAPPRLNAPRLGLYLKPTGFVNREFEWNGRDRDIVLAWSKQTPLGAGGQSGGYLTLSSLKGHTLSELRASATRYGI